MAAASLTAILTGCGTLDQRLATASREIGREAVGVTLPALPPRCHEDMPRVAPRAGEKWRAVQGRWQIVADGVDRRTQPAEFAGADGAVVIQPARGRAGVDLVQQLGQVLQAIKNRPRPVFY